LTERIPGWRVREHVNDIIKSYFVQHSVIAQARILHGLIKHKKLKHATKLLGFQVYKSKKAHEAVTKNISEALSLLGRSRKTYIRAARREITTVIVAQTTLRI